MGLPFEISEYQARLKKTKASMAQRAIDVLLVTNPANMNYLSGYDGWSFYVHQVLMVMIDEEQPIWIGREQDASGARLTTWLDDQHIISYSDDYVQSTIKHPMDFVLRVLKEKHKDKCVIAVELDHYFFTAQCYLSLTKSLSPARIVDGTTLVNMVRIIKSDKEIEYMKRAAKIAEKAIEAGINSIAAGVRECDVVATIYHAQVSGTSEFGGDYPAIVPLLPSGIKTSTPHLTWTDEKYKLGDPVILEIAGCYKRYHCPMARTVMLGPPPAHVQQLAEVVIEGLNRTLDAIKPGITCEEVDHVWKKSIQRYGYVKNSRIGYSTGLNYPPDWGEHTASLRSGDKTILEPNMTFHLIPGIWLDHYGVEISETFRVTETGYETLADFPRELFIKEV